MKKETRIAIIALCLVASITGCSSAKPVSESTTVTTTEATTEASVEATTEETTDATDATEIVESSEVVEEEPEESVFETVEETVEETTEDVVEETAEDTPEETDEVAATEEQEPSYMHGEEGYFSLIDAGYAPAVKTQFSGTCWVTAASTSMESSYLITNGEYIDISPTGMCDVVYTNSKDEGFFLDKGTNKYDFGGWCNLVTGAISNGFKDFIITDASEYELVSEDEMKDAIRNHGAMVVSMNDMHSDYYGDFDGYHTLNAIEPDEFDHAVVIIGWDDNFPKEYFVKKPHKDGAWLAQNSQGELYGNGGCFWISYDTPLIEKVIYQVSDDYDHVAYYDFCQDFEISTHGLTTTANVFHEEGTLKAVGTYTTKIGQAFHIKICDENMEEVYYEQDAAFDYPGYHVVDLDKEVDVKDFSVVITYEGSAPVEGDKWKDYRIEYRPTSNEGESFVLIEDEWFDLSSEDTRKALGIFKHPNNCCIKAIF